MTDITVIGGGIAGVSVAARLAPHASVTVLEAEDQLAYHASGRSAAMFLADYGNAVVRALNRASLPYLDAVPGLLKRKDMMLLGLPGEADEFAAQAADYGLEPVSFGEAQARVPVLNAETCAFAALRNDVCDLDTDLLVQHFRRLAFTAGAAFETGARVDRITRETGGWRVQAGDRTWQADIVVNAAGAWADPVADMAGVARLGIQPYRRSMARIPAPGGLDVSGWPFLDGVGDRWYAKPDAGALIVSPGDEDPMDPHDAWADDMVLAEGLARWEAMVTEPVTRVLANWAGLRSFAPDRALVIGRDAGEPDFVWLAGQGGYGFQTCAAASQLCADMILGRGTELDAAMVAALSPARFSA